MLLPQGPLPARTVPSGQSGSCLRLWRPVQLGRPVAWAGPMPPLPGTSGRGWSLDRCCCTAPLGSQALRPDHTSRARVSGLPESTRHCKRLTLVWNRQMPGPLHHRACPKQPILLGDAGRSWLSRIRPVCATSSVLTEPTWPSSSPGLRPCRVRVTQGLLSKARLVWLELEAL